MLIRFATTRARRASFTSVSVHATYMYSKQSCPQLSLKFVSTTGFHSGPVVADVVGTYQEPLLYCLFGDTGKFEHTDGTQTRLDVCNKQTVHSSASKIHHHQLTLQTV